MKLNNILVYGTGAVGIYFGGKLFRAGFNVVFVDLPEKAEQLQKSGLHIRSKLESDLDFEPKVVSDLTGLPVQDLILVCVKAYDTYDIALNLLPVIKPSTIMMSLQNGLDNEKVLSDLLGKSLIIGAAPIFNGRIENENTVVQNAPGEIIFGELDHQQSEREEWLSTVFSHADINHTISRSITVDLWKNYIWHNAFNSISALTKATISQILNNSDIMPTIKQIMREGQQVALAEGCEISSQVLDELINMKSGIDNVSCSMLMDIDTRKVPELEVLVGALIEKANHHGITVKVNQTVYNLLKLHLRATNLLSE